MCFLLIWLMSICSLISLNSVITQPWDSNFYPKLGNFIAFCPLKLILHLCPVTKGHFRDSVPSSWGVAHVWVSDLHFLVCLIQFVYDYCCCGWSSFVWRNTKKIIVCFSSFTWWRLAIACRPFPDTFGPFYPSAHFCFCCCCLDFFLCCCTTASTARVKLHNFSSWSIYSQQSRLTVHSPDFRSSFFLLD